MFVCPTTIDGMTDTGSVATGWTAGLDPAQLAAVDYDGTALLIVAGAGSGKTRTLVARLARVVHSGVSPDRILLVTFSRRAADELVRRLGHLVGADAGRRVHAGTFHAIAHRLLRRNGERLGLGGGFSVLDPGDAADLMHLARQVVTSEEADAARRRLPRQDTLLDIYSRVVNARQPLTEVLPRSFPWVQHHEQLIRSIFGEYTAHKRRQSLLDFDDLLLYWRAAAADQIIGPVLADAYDHVFVDEYQDTNLIQGDIVRLLRQNGRAVTVVGDDGQAIYAFRAATVRNMLEFPAQFPGATVVTLERNYRSTQPILDLANAVLGGATEGYAKRLWTAERGGWRPVLATCPDVAAQATAVADVILEYHDSGVALRDQAVLFRSAHHSDLLEVELRRRRIPFVKYGGPAVPRGRPRPGPAGGHAGAGQPPRRAGLAPAAAAGRRDRTGGGPPHPGRPRRRPARGRPARPFRRLVTCRGPPSPSTPPSRCGRPCSIAGPTPSPRPSSSSGCGRDSSPCCDAATPTPRFGFGISTP